MLIVISYQLASPVPVYDCVHHLGFRAGTHLISHIRRTHVTIANGTSRVGVLVPHNRSRFICLDLPLCARFQSPRFRRVPLLQAMNQLAAAHSNEVYHLIWRSGRFFSRPLPPERSRRKLKRTPEEMRGNASTQESGRAILSRKKLATSIARHSVCVLVAHKQLPATNDGGQTETRHSSESTKLTAWK